MTASIRKANQALALAASAIEALPPAGATLPARERAHVIRVLRALARSALASVPRAPARGRRRRFDDWHAALVARAVWRATEGRTTERAAIAAAAPDADAKRRAVIKKAWADLDKGRAPTPYYRIELDRAAVKAAVRRLR